MPLELEKAFDAALAQVDRLLGSGMKSANGSSARELTLLAALGGIVRAAPPAHP